MEAYLARDTAAWKRRASSSCDIKLLIRVFQWRPESHRAIFLPLPQPTRLYNANCRPKSSYFSVIEYEQGYGTYATRYRR